MGHVVFSPRTWVFRFYADGTESGSTPLAAEDTNINIIVGAGDVQFQLRYGWEETGGAAGAIDDDYNLQYSINGGGWSDVTGISDRVNADSGSTLVDDDPSTDRADPNGLTDGAGTYGVLRQEANDGEFTGYLMAASTWMECVFGLLADDSDITAGDFVDFRVSLNGGTPGMTNVVTPRVTFIAAPGAAAIKDVIGGGIIPFAR